MNSNVHPLIVVLILLLTGVAVGTWMWGSGEAAKIGGPAELKTGPDGHHYVQVRNYLVEHDENGKKPPSLRAPGEQAVGISQYTGLGPVSL